MKYPSPNITGRRPGRQTTLAPMPVSRKNWTLYNRCWRARKKLLAWLDELGVQTVGKSKPMKLSPRAVEKQAQVTNLRSAVWPDERLANLKAARGV